MNYQDIYMNFSTLTSKTSSLKEHYHDGYEIIFVTEGVSQFTINESTYKYNKNSLLFLNDLEKHKMDLIETPYSRYMIIINSEYLDNTIKEPTLLSIFKSRKDDTKNEFKIKSNHVEYINKVLKDLEIIYLKKYEFWQIEFISLLSNLIIFLYREYPIHFPLVHIDKQNQRIIDVQHFIDANFKTDITLDSLASDFFISKYYLAHSYKNVTGFTIKQYILLKRIAHAKNQLYYSDNSITNISMDCGFNSQSNFIRIFSKNEGMTPLQFRKYHRENID